jgi:PEP-CTERM motif
VLGSGTSTWTNNTGASIIATGGGTVDLGGVFTTATLQGVGVGTIDGTGGTLAITGTLTNSTGPLTIPNGGGIYTLVSGGQITGGTVDPGALTFGNGGILSGVTLTGNYTAASGTTFTAVAQALFETGTTTFANNIVRVGAGSPSLTIASDEAWTGDVSIYANAAGASVVNNGTITNTSGTNTFYGAGNAGFTFINGGTVDVTGGALYLGDSSTDVVTNQPGGTVEANGASTNLYFDNGSSTLTNQASNALTGGAWIAANGGTISFQATTNPIVTNNATIILNGAGSTIRTMTGAGSTYQTLEQTLVTNNGSLQVIGGRNFSSTSSGLTNSGTIQLGGGTLIASSLTSNPGSRLTGFGAFNPTGGVAIGTGVTVSPGSTSPGNFVATLSFNNIAFNQGGTYTFALMNATGVAGTDYDTLTVTGAGGPTFNATPGSPFTIGIESINPGIETPGLANFSSGSSYQWTILSSTNPITGFNASDFTINTSAFANSLGIGSFFLSSNSNDIFLNFTPVPEPSTWALLGAGLAAIAACLRRRRWVRRVQEAT